MVCAAYRRSRGFKRIERAVKRCPAYIEQAGKLGKAHRDGRGNCIVGGGMRCVCEREKMERQTPFRASARNTGYLAIQKQGALRKKSEVRIKQIAVLVQHRAECITRQPQYGTIGVGFNKRRRGSIGKESGNSVYSARTEHAQKHTPSAVSGINRRVTRKHGADARLLRYVGGGGYRLARRIYDLFYHIPRIAHKALARGVPEYRIFFGNKRKCRSGINTLFF